MKMNFYKVLLESRLPRDSNAMHSRPCSHSRDIR